ncbi:MAG: hypothetical protein OXI17_10965 [Gammaproteobacteria bacterium]|nr:hypothetical protein [Gammaproteobacteria bacterium]MDE0479886.1 hypothetical protein [Gammaproteobacteria bacterium]MDE0509142.1 hypothetical protein [Gammaproteobacteria bacterium]MXY88921.1 hypothetical protein [Gammaproteobacteria bacterium]MYA36260.1 hypothetical protein [Gammaproteobacteria bacterium]
MRIDWLLFALAAAFAGCSQDAIDRVAANDVGAVSDTEGELASGDADYFRIVLDQTGALTVYTSGGIDTVGVLEDAGGLELDYDDDSGADANFRIAANIPAGTYYAKVTGYDADQVGDYSLHVRFAPSVACRLGLLLDPGEVCDLPDGDLFSVSDDGCVGEILVLGAEVTYFFGEPIPFQITENGDDNGTISITAGNGSIPFSAGSSVTFGEENCIKGHVELNGFRATEVGDGEANPWRIDDLPTSD